MYDVNSPPVKHLGQHLTLLPPALFPCQPLDCADQRFLDLHYAPRIAPLGPHLGIEGYNLHWFDPADAPPSSVPPSFDLSTNYNPPSLSPSPGDPATIPVSPLLDPTTPVDSAVEPTTITPSERLLRAGSLATAIAASADHLFFVSIRQPGTLRPQWYLVQVDLTRYDNIEEINASDSGTTGLYFCHFYTPPVADKDKRYSHLDSRWWPIWHKFTTDPDGIVIYGDQVELHPTRRRPSSLLYVPWADTVDLCDPSTFLLGPFDFKDPSTNPRDRTPSFRQYVHHDQWTALITLCTDRGIIPPCLVPHSAPRRKRRR